MYKCLFKEDNELLILEVGTLSEFTECSEIMFYLESVEEYHPAHLDIPLNDCLVRRFSSRNDAPFLHRPLGGPALTIEHMATGHAYLQVFAQNGLRHRVDGPARITDDRQDIQHEYFYNNQYYRNDGPDTVLIIKDTGEIIHTETRGYGSIPSDPTINPP